MKTHFSHTFLNVLTRLGGGTRRDRNSSPPPDHVVLRLESVFEALSELPSQPHVAAAFELACETLEAELPSAGVAAGRYDIDADEIRILAARGVQHETLRGMAMPRARCLAGCPGEKAVITSGAAGAADWLGSGDADATAILCPIVHDGHLLGVIALAEPLCAAQFGQHDLDLVSYVAEQLANVIQAHRHRPPNAFAAAADAE